MTKNLGCNLIILGVQFSRIKEKVLIWASGSLVLTAGALSNTLNHQLLSFINDKGMCKMP